MPKVRRLRVVVRVGVVVALWMLSAWPARAQATDPHAGHVMPAQQRPPNPDPPQTTPAPLLGSFPPLTEADREAAFPDVDGHPMHDSDINFFVLFDQLEWELRSGNHGFGWDTKGWVGRDRDRVWFRTEGQHAQGRLNDAQSHLFYGRQFSRWWDVLVGVRQDFEPGAAQTWAAVGVQGLAPYWFNVEATAYVGANGRNHYRLETEYQLLLTNRVVFQPMAEFEIYGKPDLEHDRDRGLATLDFGFRLRYLIRKRAGAVCRRRVAPEALRHRRPRPRQRGADRRRALCRGTAILAVRSSEFKSSKFKAKKSWSAAGIAQAAGRSSSSSCRLNFEL